MKTTSIKKFLTFMKNENITMIDSPDILEKNGRITAGMISDEARVTFSGNQDICRKLYALGNFCATDSYHSLGCNFRKNHSVETIMQAF